MIDSIQGLGTLECEKGYEKGARPREMFERAGLTPFSHPFRTGTDAGNPSCNEGVDSVQIKISPRHAHLSEATQEYIREKAQKLRHFFERTRLIAMTVELRN